MSIIIEPFDESGPSSTVVQVFDPAIEQKFKIDDYLVVHYDTQYFPGIITEISENGSGYLSYRVNAMQKVGKGRHYMRCHKRQSFKQY